MISPSMTRSRSARSTTTSLTGTERGNGTRSCFLWRPAIVPVPVGTRVDGWRGVRGVVTRLRVGRLIRGDEPRALVRIEESWRFDEATTTCNWPAVC